MPRLGLLILLPLVCVSALPQAVGSHPFSTINAHGLVDGSSSNEPLSYEAMLVACKEELSDKLQKCIHHRPQYTDKQISTYIAPYRSALNVPWLLLMGMCLVSMRLYLSERSKRAKGQLNASIQRQELLGYVRGLREQAFDLGARAATSAKQLADAQRQLAETRAQLDDARKEIQLLELGKQQAPAAEFCCQVDLDPITDPIRDPSPPPLVGESSTPELEQLVMGAAAANDTAHNCVDQCFTTPIKAAALAAKDSGLIDSGLVMEQQEAGDLAGLVGKQLVTFPTNGGLDLHSINAKLAEEGSPYRVIQQPPTNGSSGHKPGAAATPSSPLEATAAATTAAPQQTMAVPAAAATVTAAQPVLQLHIVAAPDSNLRDQLRAEMDLERLKEEKQRLAAEKQLLTAEKQKLEAEVGQLQLQSAYINTSRGSRTPLAFGLSPLATSNDRFTPLTCATQRSGGMSSVREPETSNTATSSCFRPSLPHGSMSPGSAGSNRLSSPVQAPASPFTGSSTASAFGARSGQRVQPVPMRSLEGASSTPQTVYQMPSPKNDNLKASAEQTMKLVAQRREQSQKQLQDKVEGRTGAGGKPN